MIHFLMENLSTILISIVLLVVVVLVIRKMRNDKKAGKSSCSCGCGDCASADICHSEKMQKKDM